MYTKEQMRQFGDWLASRKDVVTGSQIDEYIAGIATVGSADVVERIEAELMKMVSDGREHYSVREMAEMACHIIEAEVERRVRGYREALEEIVKQGKTWGRNEAAEWLIKLAMDAISKGA